MYYKCVTCFSFILTPELYDMYIYTVHVYTCIHACIHVHCTHVRTPLSLLQLCSKNALGATPFMTAVSHRNYAAALRILDYVQQRTPEPKEGRGEGDKTFSFTAPSCKQPADGAPRSEASDGSLTGADLLSGAILAPMGGGGVTPLQALFSGFSSNFDLISMCLHVTGFPLGYTAQQLLRLFQTRYPSVYKAQVFKNGDSEDSSSSENSSSEEEEEEEEGEGEGEGGETEPRVRSREDVAASVRRRMFLQRRSTGGIYKMCIHVHACISYRVPPSCACTHVLKCGLWDPA